jgi:hypothetical protein
MCMSEGQQQHDVGTPHRHHARAAPAYPVYPASLCHRNGGKGHSHCASPSAMHGDATSLRLLAHLLQTKQLEHSECLLTMRTAGGQCSRGVYGSGSGMMVVWCADVVLLPLVHTHAGPVTGTSLISVCVMSNGRLLQCRPPGLGPRHAIFGIWVPKSKSAGPTHGWLVLVRRASRELATRETGIQGARSRFPPSGLFPGVKI